MTTNTEIKKAVLKDIFRPYRRYTNEMRMRVSDAIDLTILKKNAESRAVIIKDAFKLAKDQERHRILKAIDELSVTISYSDSGIINVVRVDELKTKISEADKR